MYHYHSVYINPAGCTKRLMKKVSLVKETGGQVLLDRVHLYSVQNSLEIFAFPVSCIIHYSVATGDGEALVVDKLLALIQIRI